MLRRRSIYHGIGVYCKRLYIENESTFVPYMVMLQGSFKANLEFGYINSLGF